MAAPARQNEEPASPGVVRARPRRRAEPAEVMTEERSAILALVDELAVLAADLWFAGKLDQFPLEEEPADAEDD